MILVDTNIALRVIQPSHPHHVIALRAMNLLISRDDEEIAIAPQSLYEMYVVLTRPVAANGIGIDAPFARQKLEDTKSTFLLLQDTGGVYSQWERLITQYGVMGKSAHDARLVAIMLDIHVPTILTFNDVDFRRFKEVTVLNPFDVLSLPRS